MVQLWAVVDSVTRIRRVWTSRPLRTFFSDFISIKREGGNAKMSLFLWCRALFYINVGRRGRWQASRKKKNKGGNKTREKSENTHTNSLTSLLRAADFIYTHTHKNISGAGAFFSPPRRLRNKKPISRWWNTHNERRIFLMTAEHVSHLTGLITRDCRWQREREKRGAALFFKAPFKCLKHEWQWFPRSFQSNLLFCRLQSNVLR